MGSEHALIADKCSDLISRKNNQYKSFDRLCSELPLGCPLWLADLHFLREESSQIPMLEFLGRVCVPHM
jgi:hypothetical protein